jgi:hypothetical protein
MPTSQNGWSASPTLKIRPLVVAGESFSPGIRDDDDVYTVLKYVAEQLHARVEPIVRADWNQADDWGFYFRDNRNDPTSLSNHSSATAIDYNATRHPNGVAVTRTWTPEQIREIHQILAEVDHVVRWGGDYHATATKPAGYDSMHFEINADPQEVAVVAARLRRPAKRKRRQVVVNALNALRHLRNSSRKPGRAKAQRAIEQVKKDFPGSTK